MSADFIPMMDIQNWHKPIEDELVRIAERVVRSGRYILGEEVLAFEQQTADYLGCNYAVSCANGTDALVLALKAAGIKQGDEVITTSFTFFATAEAIVRLGAVPVFVDIEPESFNLNPQNLKAAITPQTKAVLLVHLFGLPARVQEVQQLCKEQKLILIEDCAQSFGASVNGQKTGTFGALGCFSFFPSKNLGGFGDGGLISTNDTSFAERLKSLRNHGSHKRYYHEEAGYNSRLDELQAALLRVKLKYIDHYNQQRCEISQWYAESLRNSDIILPSGSGHVYHQYTTTLQQRNYAKEHLDVENIASAIYYPIPLHQQKALSETGQCICTGDLLVTELISEHCLSLPVFPGMSRYQVSRVAEALKKAISEQEKVCSAGEASSATTPQLNNRRV